MSSKKVVQTTRTEEIMNTVENKKPVLKISTSQLNIATYPTYKLNSPIKKYLPYSLNLNSKFNYKIFEKLVLISLLSVFISNNSEASSKKPTSVRPNVSKDAKIASLRRTEATTTACAGDCKPQRKVQSSALMQFLCSRPAVLNGDLKCEDASYFDDGNDKDAIAKLRAKKARGEILSPLDEATLVASNKLGWVRFPNCVHPDTGVALSGNAFLSRDKNDKDIILTSAHLVTDPSSGKFRYGCTLDQLSKAVYALNISYADFAGPRPPKDSPILATVNAKADVSLGGFNSGKMIRLSEDFMVLRLERQISTEQALDGTIRGYFKFASPSTEEKNARMIGFDKRFDKNHGGMALSYQSCEFEDDNMGSVYHLCDTEPNVSSSVITVMEDKELKFRAMHNSGSSTLSNEGSHSVPGSIFEWNEAVPAQDIQKRLLNPGNRAKGTDA